MSLTRDVDWTALPGAEQSRPSLAPGRKRDCLEELLLDAQRLPKNAPLQRVVKAALQSLRDRLELGRVALFLRSKNGRWMLGTWGTDSESRLADERGLRYLYGGMDAQLQDELSQGLHAWRLLEDAPLVSHHGRKTEILGRGWVATTALRSPGGLIGTLYNDEAFSGRAFSPERQSQIAAFLSFISLDLERAEGRSLSESHSDLSAHVRAALHLLEKDPSLTQAALAEEIGVTAQRLGRGFVRELKSPLVDFRNEIRLQKFFRLVAEREVAGHLPPLLELALASGFGSYAQFHRVFSSTLGQSPKDYLSP